VGFKKAKCEQAYIKAAIYGAPGSGKTFSTLLFAEGLAAHDKKRIAYVDTEYGTSFYAQAVPTRNPHPAAFDFDALYTRSLTEILEELEKLDFKKHGVVVVDSITHAWEAAIAAYDGEKVDGEIPMKAWDGIKRPYKALIDFLVNCPAHAFILGRETNEFRNDPNTEQLIVVGKKMQAEKNTAYEPHILLHMDPLKSQEGTAYRAWAEKDRTGLIGGRIIENPNFENVCAPILQLLGKTHAIVQDQGEVAIKDATAIGEAETKKAKVSAGIRDEFIARFQLAKTMKDLDAVSGELSAGMKKLMSTADVSALRDAYHKRADILTRPEVA